MGVLKIDSSKDQFLTDICVVVPTVFKNEGWLRLSLDSIRLQSTPAHIRIVGPHNPKLRELAAEYDAEYLVETGKSLSEALNQGFADLPDHFAYISWLGDDDLLAPGALAATRTALQTNSSAPFAFGRVRYIEPDGKSKWLIRPGAWAVPYARFGHNFIAQQGGLIRRTQFDRVGGIDNSLKNSMDQDLFLKLSQQGRPAYLPRELGAWRIQPQSISSTKGPLDESKQVMRRYRPTLPKLADILISFLVKCSDRVMLSVHCRVPGPKAPLVSGIPYNVRSAA